jgi:hypothetical protein
MQIPTAPFGDVDSSKALLADDAQFDSVVPIASEASDREAIVQAITHAVTEAVLHQSLPVRGQMTISWALQEAKGARPRRVVAVVAVSRFVTRTVKVQE